MNRNAIETLAGHADRLLGARALPRPRPGRHDQVEGLLTLAEELQGILVPVKPDASFRRQLHSGLVREARCRQAEPEPSLFRQHRRGILIGAAAVGSVASVAGVVLAFILRYRHSRASHMATG